MPSMDVAHGIAEAETEAVLIKADGTRIPLGIISTSKPSFFRKILKTIFGKWG